MGLRRSMYTALFHQQHAHDGQPALWAPSQQLTHCARALCPDNTRPALGGRTSLACSGRETLHGPPDVHSASLTRASPSAFEGTLPEEY